jgi:hypothetical protein
LFFLLSAVSGWRQSQFLRIDLLTLIILDIITLVSALVDWVRGKFIRGNRKTVFLITVILYNLLGTLITVSAYTLRSFPLLFIPLTELLTAFQDSRLFSFSWFAVRSDTGQKDIIQLFNKILIAVFSYVPIFVIRFVYFNRKYEKMKKSIQNLEREIKKIQGNQFPEKKPD